MIRRNTIQRALVLDAVRSLHNHATAEEIYQKIINEHPSVGKGTVYRNLSILTDEGEIRKVEIPGGADGYDHNCTEHYHLRCEKCGRLFDVDMEVLPDLRSNIRDTHGMKYLGCDILFRGICSGCIEKQ